VRNFETAIRMTLDIASSAPPSDTAREGRSPDEGMSGENSFRVPPTGAGRAAVGEQRTTSSLTPATMDVVVAFRWK